MSWPGSSRITETSFSRLVASSSAAGSSTSSAAVGLPSSSSHSSWPSSMAAAASFCCPRDTDVVPAARLPGSAGPPGGGPREWSPAPDREPRSCAIASARSVPAAHPSLRLSSMRNPSNRSPDLGHLWLQPLEILAPRAAPRHGPPPAAPDPRPAQPARASQTSGPRSLLERALIAPPGSTKPGSTWNTPQSRQRRRSGALPRPDDGSPGRSPGPAISSPARPGCQFGSRRRGPRCRPGCSRTPAGRTPRAASDRPRQE